MQYKRKVAKKILVKDILKSTYIKRPGWEPSGILTQYGEISRVNIMGVCVNSSGDDNSFLIDDGSGSIQVRMFTNNVDVSVGQLLNVVGRPREWNNTKYIAPDFIREIDKAWFKVHQLQAKLMSLNKKLELPVEEDEEEDTDTGPYQKILNVIAILDKGEGAEIEEIVSNIKVANCEVLIQNLVEEGEVFEISPGRVKLLE
jgi:RPA family protein